MFSLFSKKESAKCSLVFDVQSALVRGSIVVYRKGRKPEHIWSAKIEIPKKAHTGPEYLIKMVTKSIDEICEGAIHQNTGIKIDTVELALSSPWAMSFSKVVHTDFGKNTRISKSAVLDVVESIEKMVRESNNDSDVEVIERKVFDVKINGYSTDNFEKREAKTLDVSTAISIGSKSVLRKIHDHIYKHVHPKSINFHSALLLHYSALTNILPERSDFVSVHVHGELTDIVIVKKGMCSFVASFPFGVSTLLRKCSHISSSSEDTIDSALTLYTGNKLTESENARIEETIREPLKGWGHDLRKVLESFGDMSTIPSVFILSTHSHYQIFESALDKSIEGLKITKFDEAMIEKIIDYKKFSEKSPLLGMYSLAISQLNSFEL